MQKTRFRSSSTHEPEILSMSASRLLYRPLDFVMVRAPLLPVETYLTLDDQIGHGKADDESTKLVYFEKGSLVPCDPRIRWALAVGSSTLLDALERSSPSSKDANRLKGKLLRFLIRMSTRPTPYGLFAGVALGRWGHETDLAVAAEPPRTSTRPDMAWLLNLVLELESQYDIRKHLRLVTNSAAFFHADRVFLTDRVSTGESNAAQVVSVRASGVVKKALTMARKPIFYQELADSLLSTTPGATPEKVEQLLTELWKQTLLFTDLRPPLTTDNPARYVVQRLANIPAANEALIQLKSILDLALAYDALPPKEGVAAYRRLVAKANEVNKAAVETPVQVDMAITLSGQHIARSVGTEVARAAELLLRMTPLPSGLTYFEAYRRAFVSHYGHNREVALLELLDPNFGLGSPSTYSGGANGIAQFKTAIRSETLLNLASSALHDHKHVIELDEDTLKRLETWTPSLDTAPLSLDLYAFVAATSVEAVDAGQFQIIIGPNLGAQAAGRNLGRFSGMIGKEAQNALNDAACDEEVLFPNKLWTELVYLPRKLRFANVVIRPVVRHHEIALGVSSGVDTSRVIPLDELVVGIRNNRFYLRWTAENIDVVICAGHMLSSLSASGLCRFLSEVGRDGMAQLSSFDWGPASGFPFLPRVQVGRIVLRQAQWRIDTITRKLVLPPDSPKTFQWALERWREQWQVPQYVYMSTGDNRLLLNLESPSQVEELRAEVRHLREGSYMLVQEVLPALDQIWTEGPEGHYATEFVVSLVLQNKPGQSEVAAVASSGESLPNTSFSSTSCSTVASIDHLRPPGSDWLFVKLYCGQIFEEDLIAYPIRTFAEQALSTELAQEWFYVRYNDPDTHIRLRFRGEPERLVGQLLPKLCTWATELMTEGYCLRFVFDTYDREVERYGGLAGTEVAESIFAADSCTATELIYLIMERILQLDRITLAVLSVNNLLANLGLTEAALLEWLIQHVTSRNEVGQEYRQRKTLLRSLLHDPNNLQKEPGGEAVAQAFATRCTTLVPVAVRLTELAEGGELSQSLETLYSSFVHMHCNRLFGSDRSAEQRVLGLLLRTRQGLRVSSV